MKKRMLSLCLAVLMLTLVLTGCDIASFSESLGEVLSDKNAGKNPSDDIGAIVLESDGVHTKDGISYAKLKDWNLRNSSLGDSQDRDNLNVGVYKFNYYNNLTPQETFSEYIKDRQSSEEVVEHSKRVESFTTKDGKEAYSGYILTYLAENYYCDEYIIIPSEELEIVICGSADVYEYEYETEAELEQAKQTVPEHLKQVSAYIRDSISLVPSKNTDEDETSSSSKDTSETSSSSESAETSNTTSITRGTINGNVYESKSTGLKFTKPDNWVYSSDEELAAIMNAAMYELDTSNFLKTLSENITTYDFMAVDALTGDSVTIYYQNLAKLFATNLTEQDYYNSLKATSVKGTEVNFVGESEWTTLCGKKYLRQKFDMTVNEYKFYQAQYVRKIDDFLQIVLISANSEQDINKIEALFN